MTSRTSVRAILMASLLMTPATAMAQTGPAQTASHLPPDVLALACAPRAGNAPQTALRVTGGQDVLVRRNYAPGDLITINAGMKNGLQVGEEFYTRRVLTARDTPGAAPGILVTSGWIRVYAIDDDMSLATITHACDTVEVGDFLDPFVLPTPPVVTVDRRKPERDNYGRVTVGLDRRIAFAKGDFFVLDRGRAQGVTPGAHFVLYRNKQADGNFLYDLGEAIAVDVRNDTSTLQVTVSREAILTGDLVAIRK